jgi:hypothetical protein
MLMGILLDLHLSACMTEAKSMFNAKTSCVAYKVPAHAFNVLLLCPHKTLSHRVDPNRPPIPPLLTNRLETAPSFIRRARLAVTAFR